jgi:hypothetical protein
VTGAVPGAGFGAVGYGIVTEIGPALMPAGGAAGSALGSTLGGLGNVLTTILGNPFGSREGFSVHGRVPTAAPTTNA